MRVWTVHLSERWDGDWDPATVAPVLVPERFTWLAALFPAPWLLLHGLWLPLLGYLVLAAGAAALLLLGFAPLGWALLLLLHVLAGFEAQNFRRWRLDRRGHRFLGVVSGRDADSALVRLLDDTPSLRTLHA